MPVTNADIARILNRVADLLEIQDANPFRVRAYRNAARSVDDQAKSVARMVEEDVDLTRLKDIGDDLAGKISEIVTTGRLAMLKKIEQDLPAELTGLLQVAQLGPKRVGTLYRELGIRSLDDLAKAAKKGKIRSLAGFGEKLEGKILSEVERLDNTEVRWRYADAEQVVTPLLDYLQQLKNVERIEIAGSFRRRKETVGDLDLLAICDDSPEVMRHFIAYEDVSEVLARGRTKSSVRLQNGLQVDLRVVEQRCYGAALYYFTGSRDHNIATRKIAGARDLKINEYGVFRLHDQKSAPLGGKDEEEIFSLLDLPFIPPELRENHGEIEAAQKSELPRLVTPGEIRGDLHVHSLATDGRNSIAEMVAAARELGYSYLAITDHSQAVTVAGGLDRKRLLKQIEEIERLNDELSDFRILKGIEVDILADGSLDLPDEILSRLDLRVCSVHSRFNLSRDKQTERIIRAMDNRYFNILGHPSGRLINEREAYRVDMDRLLEAAAERRCIMELNAHPERLDLNDRHCRQARDRGVMLAISTDAHSVQGLNNMKYGIYQARRGWLAAADVVNSRPLAELMDALKR